MITIPENTWTLVAENVRSSLITIKQWQPNRYYQTHRVTGDPAPIGDYNEETSTVTHSREIKVESSERIDLYMWCVDQSGSVVVTI
jgi:hypothetical protein